MTQAVRQLDSARHISAEAVAWLDGMATDHAVSSPAFRLAYVLAGFFGERPSPTADELASMIGMTGRSVGRLTRELQAANVLDVHPGLGRGNPSKYQIAGRRSPMAKPTLVVENKADQPRAMVREDRRIIFAKLEEVYLDEKRGYSNGWSDQRVAKDLCVPFAWVATIRDENFGAEGSNDEIRSLVNEGRSMVESALAAREQLVGLADTIAKLQSAIEEKLPQIERFDRELKRVAKAAGMP